MQKQDLINQLENYQPFDEYEKNFKIEIINFIKNNNNCFERSCEKGHITASSWILNKDGTKVLLTHHKKLNMWFQLGGHCDGNPNALEVSLKEAKEESGINEIFPLKNEIFDIDIHLIPESKKEKAHYHYDIRYLLYAENENIKINHESKELRWVSKDKNNLPEVNSSVLRMFEKWKYNKC